MDGTPQSQITTQLIASENSVQTAQDEALPAYAAAPLRSLDQLGKGEHAIVADVNASLAFGALDGLVTRRLWELGFLPGAPITVIGFGLLNRDPIAVKIGGTKFALRRAEAQKILVTSKLDTFKSESLTQ